MLSLVQQSFTEKAAFLKEKLIALFYTLWYAIPQINSYVTPTLSQRLGVGGCYRAEFAYQKVNSRFDIYPIRAIIRDEYI